MLKVLVIQAKMQQMSYNHKSKNNAITIYRSQFLKILDDPTVECYNHCITEPGSYITDPEEFIVLSQMCKEYCGIPGGNHCIKFK